MKNFIQSLLAVLLIGFTTHATAVPKLNSYPTAQATIFLDFDGEVVEGTLWNTYYNNNATLNCAAAAMSDAQITETFKRVAEDYRPFNINVTTDESVFLAAPFNKRIRVIITPSSSWIGGVGGIAFIGSFTWGDDTPCFVFSDRLGPNVPKFVGECCSHESGHTFGLQHQSTYDANCIKIEEYNSGSGSGETGFAPIMGNGYYQNMTGWDNGPTRHGCSITQDNLNIITSSSNGFGFRTDDFSDSLLNSTGTTNSSLSTSGIISTQLDKDVFKIIVTRNSLVNLRALPYSVDTTVNKGANLDLRVELYDGTKKLIRTYDPLDKMSVLTGDTVVGAGTYYYMLSGTGNRFVDDYGSLGSYSLNISVTDAGSPLPINDVLLSGNIINGNHQLSWKVDADEPIATQTLEYSADGTDFETIAELGPDASKHILKPERSGTLFYRLKVVSVVDQTVYSNIISLGSEDKMKDRFIIPTLFSDRILINASDDFTYRVMSLNGQMVASGKGFRGANQVNLMNRPGGMYLVQILSNNELMTERVIKQ
jgi:hypothetical protein